MEITVSASPPRTTAPRQVPSHAQVDEAITNMVMQIRRTGAPTSTVTSPQRDSQASGTDTGDTSLTRIPRMSTKKSDPPQASGSSHSRSSHRDRTRSHRQPVFPAHETTIWWTAPGAQPRWRDEDPESLEDIEGSIHQVAGGATDVATENLIWFVAGIRARLDEGLQCCERELQDARTSASRFGPPGPVQHLMGQVQHVWNRAGVRQNRINALVKEKEQARSQCDQMATAQTTAQQEIGQLRAHNKQLQRENERLRQELLAAKATPHPAGPPSISSESSSQSGLTNQDRIRQLTATADRIRGEREALRKDNVKLKAANEEWRTEVRREKLRNDTTIDDLWNRLQAAENKLRQSQGQASSHLPSHREMGGHRTCLPAGEGQVSRSITTEESQRHSVLSTSADQPASLEATSSPQTSQRAPYRSASAMSQEPLDQEEAMESDSQAESESQEQ